MLLFGTQMHIVTFLFICIEVVILFYQVIYKLARPEDKSVLLNIILLFLLIIYNVTGGLLPDPSLPGSEMLQNIIAYGTGFITPCFFPYYVYKSFDLQKMKFHAYKGVFLCLVLPYALFTTIYVYTGKLSVAKDILGLPLLYAAWVVVSLVKAIRFKYKNNSISRNSMNEVAVMLLSLAPWIALPVVTFFDLSQALEASITNTGFLLLMGLQIKEYVDQARAEHQKLVSWNATLQKEVDKRTEELKRMTDQKTTAFINVAHEIKTPLTLINNYLEDYMGKHQESTEIIGVKKNIEKLNRYIVNFFDVEKMNNGFVIYNNNQVTNFSELLRERALLFQMFAHKNNILLNVSIEDTICIRSAPDALDRIVNNLLENAFKFIGDQGEITVELQSLEDKIAFSVRDNGVGITPGMEDKIFLPYFQINNPEIRKNQGLGLGLPIVKTIVDEVGGEIAVFNNAGSKGATFLVYFPKYEPSEENEPAGEPEYSPETIRPDIERFELHDTPYEEDKQTVLLVEDNTEMLYYILNKLKVKFNIYSATNGREAIIKLKSLRKLPDLIISDVMMDSLDGFGFMEAIAANSLFTHIPVIFLSAKSSNKDKLRGLSLGAVDFIEKPFSIDLLIKKVESVLSNARNQRKALLEVAYQTLQGERPVPPEPAINALQTNVAAYHLTAREEEVAKLLMQGSTYKSIAAALFISEKTVTKHVQNLYSKLEVSNKLEMMHKLEEK